nr:phosphate/phosphite/phosphonate ABC transporter substrate-binding protein [Noviherbaspirillum galbum]
MSFGAMAQDGCPNRGDLDAAYCDADKDLVADTPSDPKKLKSPSNLAFTFTPLEDSAAYEKLFKPFTDYLAQCTGKKVGYLSLSSNTAEIEAMRAGSLHVGGFSAGPTNFAVNIAGAVPFAVIGNQKEYQSYTLIMIVRKDSAIQKMPDIKGKKVAHTSSTSNSGHLAPMALFPKIGVVPDKDYKILFSGKHDHSILGVQSGEYDAAAVASDVFDRMVERGQIKADAFRIIYRSDKFPTQAFAYAHDLEPGFRDQMLKCFYDYRFSDELKKAFAGSDRFFPINYKKDFFMVRYVSQSAGESFNRVAYDKQVAKEKEKK